MAEINICILISFSFYLGHYFALLTVVQQRNFFSDDRLLPVLWYLSIDYRQMLLGWIRFADLAECMDSQDYRLFRS